MTRVARKWEAWGDEKGFPLNRQEESRVGARPDRGVRLVAPVALVGRDVWLHDPRAGRLVLVDVHVETDRGLFGLRVLLRREGRIGLRVRRGNLRRQTSEGRRLCGVQRGLCR